MKANFKEKHRKIRINYFKEISSYMREIEIRWRKIQPSKDSGKRR